MKKYRIREEIEKLSLKQAKVYHYLYTEFGFELGFGKAGKYEGHSHLYFYDIVFSKNEILTTDADGNKVSGNLLIVPPKTFIGDVIIDDFFFIKFCPTKDLVILPDKILRIEKEGKIKNFSDEMNCEITWYKNYLSKKSFVNIDYSNMELKLTIGQTNIFSIL